ncbi:MAG: ABC transporter ATP-binding protein [Ignavibacterium sp.]
MNNSNNENIIQLKNVFISQNGREILKDINLNIKKGQVAAILGPSGAGKSSILKVMLGLWRPRDGSVFINGFDITRLSENDILPIRRKMGIVFQNNALFDSLTVEENIGFFLNENSVFAKEEIDKRVQYALQFVNLEGTNKFFPDELSGGMKKRVAIARALVTEPEIILYDEPTTGLDPINAKAIIELIQRLREHGSTSIIVTHILHDAVSIADLLTLLDNGRIIETGSVNELLYSKNQFVQDFFYEVFQDAELLQNKQ